MWYDTLTQHLPIQLCGTIVMLLCTIILSCITYRSNVPTNKLFYYVLQYITFTSSITYLYRNTNIIDAAGTNINELYTHVAELLLIYLLVMSALYNNKGTTIVLSCSLIIQCVLPVSPYHTLLQPHHLFVLQYVQCNLVMQLCLFQLYDTTIYKQIAHYMYQCITCYIGLSQQFTIGGLLSYQILVWIPVLIISAYNISNSTRHQLIELQLGMNTITTIYRASTLIALSLLLRMIINAYIIIGDTSESHITYNTYIWCNLIIDVYIKINLCLTLALNTETMQQLSYAYDMKQIDINVDKAMLIDACNQQNHDNTHNDTILVGIDTTQLTTKLLTDDIV